MAESSAGIVRSPSPIFFRSISFITQKKLNRSLHRHLSKVPKGIVIKVAMPQIPSPNHVSSLPTGYRFAMASVVDDPKKIGQDTK